MINRLKLNEWYESVPWATHYANYTNAPVPPYVLDEAWVVDCGCIIENYYGTEILWLCTKHAKDQFGITPPNFDEL